MPHARFTVQTEDGVSLRGVHLRTGHDTLAIYCHGFLANKNYGVIPRFVEALAEDVDALAFDFRGHGESEGESTLGHRESLDADAIMRYARTLGYRRIWMVGSSMGGATSLLYAAQSPDVAGIATIGAFAYPNFSWPAQMALQLLRYPLIHAAVRLVRRCRIQSVSKRPNAREVVRAISPRPLLIIHGELDPLVPLSHAQALYAAAGEPKKLIVIPRGGHDLPNLNRRTRDWIVNWLGYHSSN